MIKLIKSIYYHKWFPRLLYKKFDGGKDSGVVGYFLIEWKKVFSVGILHFSKGSRESSHSHAFNAVTWWLSGGVTEYTVAQTRKGYKTSFTCKDFNPSLKPKITLRSKVHKVFAHKDTFALTFRGPWRDTWKEISKDGEEITLTHGRIVLSGSSND